MVWGALPLWLGLALLVDLAWTRRLFATRLVAFLAIYLACEMAGLAAALGVWLGARLPLLRGQEREQRALRALQRWWAGALFGALCRVFRLSVEVEGLDAPLEGPLFVFMRHASIIDTLLPANVVAERTGLRLRYVLKRELLLDPCLDVVGNRLPNAFVDRESPDSKAEIARVQELAAGLGPDDAILIYPEGTRFTRAKRERALARLAQVDPALARRGAELRRLLPPKLGGALGLLDANPHADVLFVAHAGLDGYPNVRDLLDPHWIGTRLRLRAERVPRAEIPREREARAEWLFTKWARMDAWVERQLGEEAP
jgi:1-acyl-sn-glycerol-3-phosphate acyltransferase